MARKAAMAIEKFLVKAKGLKRRPSCPSKAKIGRKEMAITNSEKKLGRPTSLIALIKTSLKLPTRPPACQRSSFLWAFSTTTTAASTKAPIATAIPPKDMMLEVVPVKDIGMKDKITAMG